jgi:hypothetical protein
MDPSMIADLYIKELEKQSKYIQIEEVELQKIIQVEKIKYITVFYNKEPIIFRSTSDSFTFGDMLRESCVYFNIDPNRFIIKD